MVENSVHQHASHKIAIMHPTHNWRSYKAQIISRWIAHKIFEKVQMKLRLRCFELYEQLVNQNSLRIAAGWIFGAYIHDLLGAGRLFEAHQLPIINNNTPHLKFEICQSGSYDYFTDADNLAKLAQVEGG
ncbi:hypothetical protein HOY82DRAFT_610603 [Tuber indicum]|nr:hypothetical protein HOY82DRAFT_610603 [Tuber indicum]